MPFVISRIGESPSATGADVATLTNGDYLIAWKDQNNSISFQRFDITGSPITSVVKSKVPSGSSWVDSPVIIPLPNGGFIISHYYDAGKRGFSYSQYSSQNNLVGDSNLVGEAGWSYASMAGLRHTAYANGYVISASHSETGGSGGNPGEGAWDVNLYLKDLSGNTIFSGKTAQNNFGAQINPEITPLSDGTSVLVSWSDKSGLLDGSEFGIYGRIFSTTSKSFTTNPFLINQISSGSQGGWNGAVSTVSLPGGGFASFWVNDINAGIYRETISDGEIKGRIFSLVNGNYEPSGSEFSLSTISTGNQNFIHSSVTSDGNILVVFSVVNPQGVTSIIGKELSDEGNIVKPDFIISTNADGLSQPDISWLPDGSAIAVWTRDNTSTSAFGDRTIVSKIIPASDLSKNISPVIISNGGSETASIIVQENGKAVTEVATTDLNINNDFTYLISGGADAALFQINAFTGQLSFRTAPNFEAPADFGRNNVYDVVVQVSDGALIDSQSIAVSVTNVNEAPTFSASSQSVSATAGAAKTITLAATDVDGDALTYTVAIPSKGTASISGTTLTYTPSSLASGSDSFVVTASDGKGGTATQTINASIAGATAPKSFTMYTTAGWAGSVGGNGTVFGSNGFEDVSILFGQVSLDGSFNRGGDVLRVPGDGNDFVIGRTNASTAFLEAGDKARISVPIGSVGLAVAFTDGVRKLVYSGGYKIGGQSFTVAATPITGAADGSTLPAGADATAQATVYMNSAALVGGVAPNMTISGKARIVGTNEADIITLGTAGAELVFDGSFNRGGDTIVLNQTAGEYTAAKFNASTLVLSGSGEKLTIPVGIKGLTLRFADEDRVLVYKNGALHIGEQSITATTATALTPSTITLSIDQGTPNNTVILDSAGKVIFTDDVSQTTNVILTSFGRDDLIRVTGATALQYNFAISDADAKDLEITFTDQTTSSTNTLILDDVIQTEAFIADYATASQAVGWNFMTFA